jgi:hypothetical protein
MSSYWIRDPKGGVVGPIGLTVLKDVAQQVGVSAVSTDGKLWVSPEALPEVLQAIRPGSPAERRKREVQEAQRAELMLDKFRELADHELFGVPRGSDPRVFRQAFLSLAKPYHPGRLAKDAAPELVRAYMELFQFLSTKMVVLEKAAAAAAPAPEPPVVRGKLVSPPAPAPAAPVAKAEASFVKGQGNWFDAKIRVTPETSDVFTVHKLINLQTNGLFLVHRHDVALGTYLNLNLSFVDEPRDIKSRGAVVLESRLTDPRYLPGIGLRMDRLSTEDKGFIQRYLEKANKQQR